MMEEKKTPRAVAKKLITPNMQEWLPVSPKMPEKPQQSAEEEALLEPAAAQGLESENLESENLETENLESEAENHNASSLIQNLETQDFESDLRELDSEEVDSEELISEEEEPSKETFVFAPPVEEEPHSRVALSDNKSGLGMGWYVVHTYSGYENKVKANIEKTIANRHLEDQILEVCVPLQEVVEMKNDVQKVVQKKLFPGYVLLYMIMNDDTWYVVRNTRGVTGFVGPGSKPVPLTEAEMRSLGIQIETKAVEVDYVEGEWVMVTGGPWKDTSGIVRSINAQKQLVTIGVELFGSETPVEISFADVRKL